MSPATPYAFAYLAGTAILPSLVYGINSTLVFMTLGLLWKGRRTDTQKRTLIMTGYVVLICALSTAHLVLSCITEVIFQIDLRPGSDTIYVPVLGHGRGVVASTDIVYAVITWLTEGLLVRVIFDHP